MLARRAQFRHAILAGHVTPLDYNYRAMVSGTTSMFMQQGSDPTQAHGLRDGLVQRQAAMQAYVDNFCLMGVTFLCMIPLMFLMKKGTPPTKPPPRLTSKSSLGRALPPSPGLTAEAEYPLTCCCN